MPTATNMHAGRQFSPQIRCDLREAPEALRRRFLPGRANLNELCVLR